MKYGNKVTHPKFLALMPKGRRLQDSGFTLVELIVVITILAILGTIAFISLQGYSATSRDSVRISDTGNMKTTLELFHLNAGKYPLPDNGGELTYSGITLFYQGTFGENVIQNVSRNMNEVPTDPLTELEYIYSVSNNKNELEILSLMETDDFALNSISQTNAAALTVTPKISGNYNGLFIKTATHIVPLPSIINTEVSLGSVIKLEDNNNIHSMVVNNGLNIPNHGNVATSTGNLEGLFLSVYDGTINKDSSDAAKAAVMEAIQDAYTGSTLATADIYEYVLSISGETELAGLLDTVVLDGNTSVASTTITIPTFPTTCGNGTVITAQDAIDNKTNIISNITNYIGCEINDYTGTSIPGSGVYIAGLTGADIMVVSKSDISASKQWGCSATTTSATSLTDGMANTTQFLSICNEADRAPKLCRDIGGNWYLPAKDELNTIYSNKSSLGTFADNYYWSSTEYSAVNAWRQYFGNGKQYSSYKNDDGAVRCASRF